LVPCRASADRRHRVRAQPRRASSAGRPGRTRRFPASTSATWRVAPRQDRDVVNPSFTMRPGRSPGRPRSAGGRKTSTRSGREGQHDQQRRHAQRDQEPLQEPLHRRHPSKKGRGDASPPQPVRPCRRWKAKRLVGDVDADRRLGSTRRADRRSRCSRLRRIPPDVHDVPFTFTVPTWVGQAGQEPCTSGRNVMLPTLRSWSSEVGGADRTLPRRRRGRTSR